LVETACASALEILTDVQGGRSKTIAILPLSCRLFAWALYGGLNEIVWLLLLVCRVTIDLSIAALAERLVQVLWVVSLSGRARDGLGDRVDGLLDSSATAKRVPVLTRPPERVLSTLHLVLKLVDLHLLLGSLVSDMIL